MATGALVKGKGKAEVIDLTVELSFRSDKGIQLPSPISSPLNLQPPASTPSSSSGQAGPSSSALSSTFISTQGTKRKAQQALITSFFPNKKNRFETILPPLSTEQKKVARKAVTEAEKAAKAESRRLEKEQREAKKADEDAVKAARAEERRIKKELREADAARKKVAAQWKDDWKEWINQHRCPETTFAIPLDGGKWDQEHYMNVQNSKMVFGITRNELNCLPHCDVENPNQPKGEEWAPMKLYRKEDLERLAWRKKGIVNGVPQRDMIRLLWEGRRLFEQATEGV